MFSRTLLFTTLLSTTILFQGANYLAFKELQRFHPNVEFSPIFHYPSQLNGSPADVTSTLPLLGSFRYRVGGEKGWRYDYEQENFKLSLSNNFQNQKTGGGGKWFL